jgi:hypothetical protein
MTNGSRTGAALRAVWIERHAEKQAPREFTWCLFSARLSIHDAGRNGRRARSTSSRAIAVLVVASCRRVVVLARSAIRGSVPA